MGLIHFLVPNHSYLSNAAAKYSYMAGIDGAPWQTTTITTDDGLIVDRPSGDSGNFSILWSTKKRGEIVLSTASLMERSKPYILPIELARGTINRIRNQAAAWEAAGMVISDLTSKKLNEAMALLSDAVTNQTQPAAAAEIAQQAIEVALSAMQSIMAGYTQQALASRRKQTEKLATFFAVNLGDIVLQSTIAQSVTDVFNAVALPMTWSNLETEDDQFDWTMIDQQIQWSQSNSLRIAAGPLLRLDRSSLPHWIYLWEDDFEQLLHYVERYVWQVVGRYKGKINLWQSAGRFHGSDAMSLNEEQSLRLVVRAVEVARSIDPETPLVVSLDQPWCESMVSKELDLTKMAIADTLVRADLGISGFCLEINLGYHPPGTLPRDIMDISHMIDCWSVFGLPMVISLTVPSENSNDPQARLQTIPMVSGFSNGPSQQTQQQTAESLIPMLLAKQVVQGIIWNQLDDSVPHDYPHGGLIDSSGNTKPTLNSLKNIRQQYLS